MRARNMVVLEGASVEIFVGQANLMVQARFVGASTGGAGTGSVRASAGFLSSFCPHANMMHLLRPKTASTFCSGFERTTTFCNGPMLSSSCKRIETGRSNGFLLNIGAIWWNAAEGSGGLGVLARVPGLVKPPSLVSSAAVPLLLLHVETHDRPRSSLLSDRSSTGEVVLELHFSALVRRDSLRSRTSLDLIKDVVDECWRVKGVGRTERSNSGGSSTSAMASSSALMAGTDVLGALWVVLMPAMLCLPM